jgi:hypothetical protein
MSSEVLVRTQTYEKRLLPVSFESAVNIWANDTEFSSWIDAHPDKARLCGLLRDCLGHAARTCAARLNAATDYLSSTGIGEETARRFMLGRGLGQYYMKKSLQKSQFSEHIIQLAGLVNQYGQDRFQGHVMVPIFHNGQVVDFYGRIVNDKNGELGKHSRLPSEENPETGRPEWEPWVITSAWELFPLTHEELNRRGQHCNDIVPPGHQRYSQQVVKEYVVGERSKDLAGTFSRIKSLFQRNVDFSDPKTYDTTSQHGP